MIFDIQINFKVDATNEARAENQLNQMLREVWQDGFDKQYKVVDWETIEFIPLEGVSCSDPNCSNL